MSYFSASPTFLLLIAIRTRSLRASKCFGVAMIARSNCRLASPNRPFSAAKAPTVAKVLAACRFCLVSVPFEGSLSVMKNDAEIRSLKKPLV